MNKITVSNTVPKEVGKRKMELIYRQVFETNKSRIFLSQDTFKKFYFYFQYPLDRVGSCKFHLKKDGGKAIVHEITFNTSMKEESKSWMRGK